MEALPICLPLSRLHISFREFLHAALPLLIGFAWLSAPPPWARREAGDMCTPYVARDWLLDLRAVCLSVCLLLHPFIYPAIRQLPGHGSARLGSPGH